MGQSAGAACDDVIPDHEQLLLAEQAANFRPAQVLAVTQAAGGEVSPAARNPPTIHVHWPPLAAQSVEVV